MGESVFWGQFGLATHPRFVQRVQVAAVNAALALMADPTTEAKLASYCSALLNSPAQFAANLAFGVAANGAMSAESSDSDLQWTLNSVIRAFAGVLPKAS